jgi:hypothetical protein
MDIVKSDYRINSIPPVIDCNQTAMVLPPVKLSVFLIAKSFLVKRGRFGEISETPLQPGRGSSVSGMCIFSILLTLYSTYISLTLYP